MSNPNAVACATIAPVGTSCLAGWYCSMHSSVLGNTFDEFSSPVDCVAPSHTVKASAERSFQVSPA